MSAAAVATVAPVSYTDFDISCAICLECVDVSMNVIKTECKHCFHSSCFLQNAAHNGFNCPMCRSELASLPSDEEDDEDDDEDEVSEEESEDYSLRGARWLMMRAEGEPIEEDDTDDDETLDDADTDSIEDDYDDFVRYEPETTPVVSIDQASALLEQNNVSYKELVAFLIAPDSRHQSDLQEYSSARMKQIARAFATLGL